MLSALYLREPCGADPKVTQERSGPCTTKVKVILSLRPIQACEKWVLDSGSAAVPCCHVSLLETKGFLCFLIS